MSLSTEPEAESAEVAPDRPATGNQTEGAESGEATLSEDDLFHLLQNDRRRAVVRYLDGREGPVEMRDVAEQVAAWEHDTTLEALTSKQRQRVYIALYQSHLETLEDAGVIRYNKPRGIVEPTPQLEYVAAYLTGPESGDESAASENNWLRYYLLASGASTLLFGGTTYVGALAVYLSSALVSLFTIAAFTSITAAMLLTDVS